MTINIHNLHRLQSVLMLAVFMCACVPLSAHAFFGDKEFSGENTFSASSLDLALSGGQDDDVSEVTVTNTGEIPFTYTVRVEATASSLCDDVEVKYNGGVAQPASLALPLETVLAPGASVAHEFEFIFDEDAHAGEVCVLDYIYEAHQNGYVHGEAFFDTETDLVTLNGATPATTGEVVISEIMYNPADNDQLDNGGEWIEVYNGSGASIDLTTWKFYESDTNHGITAPYGSPLVGPGQYAIIAHDSFQFEYTFTSVADVLIFDSSFDLPNDPVPPRALELKDGSGVVVYTATYEHDWDNSLAYGNGDTLQRRSDDTWCAEAPTPGEENNCPLPKTTSFAPTMFTFTTSTTEDEKALATDSLPLKDEKAFIPPADEPIDDLSDDVVDEEDKSVEDIEDTEDKTDDAPETGGEAPAVTNEPTE